MGAWSNKPKTIGGRTTGMVGRSYFYTNSPGAYLRGQKLPIKENVGPSGQMVTMRPHHNFSKIVWFIRCLVYLCATKGGVYYDHCKRKRERIHRKSAEAF